MVRQNPLQLTLAACLLIWAGCATSPALQPKGRVEAPVQAAAGRAPIKARFLNEIVIHLPPVAVAENRWTVILNDERFLKQVGSIQPAPGGSATATFLAIREGRRPIHFLATNPAAKSDISNQRYEVTVLIE